MLRERGAGWFCLPEESRALPSCRGGRDVAPDMHPANPLGGAALAGGAAPQVKVQLRRPRSAVRGWGCSFREGFARRKVFPVI